MARMSAGGSLDLQIDMQILEELRNIASILRSQTGIGSGGGGGGAALGGGASFGATWQRLSSLAHVSTIIDAVLRAFDKLAHAATEVAGHLAGFSQVRNALGSSGGTTALLGLLGGTLGVDMAAVAMRSLEATRSGLGAAAGARAGLAPQFDIGTFADRGRRVEILLEEMVRINKSQGAGAARAFAQQAGIGEAFDYLQISKATLDALRARAKIEEEMYSPERIRLAYEYNAKLALVHSQWSKFVASLGGAFLPRVNKILDFWNQPVAHPLFPNSGDDPGRSTQPARAAMNAQTEATKQNTMELRRLQGVYGGGARARSAIPAAFGPGYGFFIQDNLRAHTIKLGAYAIQM
jgi:hypothetical protein